MNIEFLGKFVTQTAVSTGSIYTLDGEPIAASDLGDPQGMLPLVIAAIHRIGKDLQGSASSLLSLLEPADPKSHLLGFRVTKLPDAPDGALLLLANHAVRHYLNRSPQPGLTLPDPAEQAPTSRICELQPHLAALGLRSPTKTKTHSPGF